MSEYRRWYVPGGTYFFTVITCGRAPLFGGPMARRLLGESMRVVRGRFPSRTLAIVLPPDHLHCVWTLPADDTDYDVRWNQRKRRFSADWLRGGGGEVTPTASRRWRDERGVWQRRFWEHVVRDQDDFERCIDSIHYNPVKHGHAGRPLDWPWSSFARYVREGRYPADWGRVEPVVPSWLM